MYPRAYLRYPHPADKETEAQGDQLVGGEARIQTEVCLRRGAIRGACGLSPGVSRMGRVGRLHGGPHLEGQREFQRERKGAGSPAPSSCFVPG